ncbi:hypothetical protein KM1_058440 [Entamoeba histolytica HM-3:IMSS]|uniref:Peptidase S74 domain-containing protein n=3 Tax=Entamoeba histolytica TaxID=5759 RepID=M7WL97_ENTHI|nr:hypothetical protein KM1_058440 [Entamoeba histolytica HM-3:IMSS]
MNQSSPPLVLVESEQIPRTQNQRKKNWKCTFPKCEEAPKTRYNCYAHVWDAHLRTELSKPGKNPNNLLLTTFKLSPQKDDIKRLCEDYMIKLIDKYPPTKIKKKIIINNNDGDNNLQYPFAFDPNSKSFDNEIHTNSSSNSVINNETTPSRSIESVPISYSGAPLAIDTPIGIEMQPTPIKQNINTNEIQQMIKIPSTGDYQISPEDFIKIEKINENLRQLHVLGEIFAENGFLVRSDARSKTDIEEIHNSLNGILSLVGVSYSYKNDSDNKKYGFVAQDVQKIYPDLVKEDDTGKLTVDYLGIIPLLVEALKEIHNNAQGLREIEEINGVSKKVDCAITQLEKVLFEMNCNNPQREEKSKFIQWKIRMMHIFGPISFLIFSCLFSTITCIIIAIIFPSMYFLMGITILLSIILWIFVLINKTEVMNFLKTKKAFFPIKNNINFKWRLSQYITWYIVFSLLMSMLMLSIIIGYHVITLVSCYIIGVIISLVICYFINKASYRFGFPYQYSFIVLVIFQAICIAVIILCTVYQPFYEGKNFGDDSQYVVHLSDNVEVRHVTMPQISWNCFSPKIISEPYLPNGLSFNTSQKLFCLSHPFLMGIPHGDIVDSVVKVSLQCNGIVLLDYPTLTFKTCAKNTDPGLCSINSCGYCRSSKSSFCGICDDYFTKQCQSVAGISNC